MWIRLLVLVVGLGLSFVARAQDTPAPPPPLIEGGDRDMIEPQVRIIQRRDATVEEYRIAGQLYMVRVIPERGKAYYLVDADGNGDLERRMDELDPKLMVPGWVIFRW